MKDSDSNMGSTINDENVDKSADMLLSDETYKNSRLQEKSIDGRFSVPQNLIVKSADLYNRETYSPKKQHQSQSVSDITLSSITFDPK